MQIAQFLYMTLAFLLFLSLSFFTPLFPFCLRSCKLAKTSSYIYNFLIFRGKAMPPPPPSPPPWVFLITTHTTHQHSYLQFQYPWKTSGRIHRQDNRLSWLVLLLYHPQTCLTVLQQLWLVLTVYCRNLGSQNS